MQHRLIRGLGALVLLAAILVGVPLALIALAGNPLPTSFESLLATMAAPDLGGVFLMGTVVPCLAWIAWLYLVACVALEAFELVRRGRSAPRRRTNRNPGRRFASTLLTAIVVMIGGSAVMGPAYAAEAAPSVAIEHAEDSSVGWQGFADEPSERDGETTEHTTPQSGAAATDYAEITVREGDSLWALAETHLGDGARYPEITELNRGVPQFDGGALDEDLWLTPGWRIMLPHASAVPETADERGAGVAASPSGAATVTAPADPVANGTDATSNGEMDPSPDDSATVVVQTGDTLWELAEVHLGDGARYDELATASGLSDPSTIHPGDEVTMPFATDDGTGIDDDASSAPEDPATEDETDPDAGSSGGMEEPGDVGDDTDGSFDPVDDAEGDGSADDVADASTSVPAHPAHPTADPGSPTSPPDESVSASGDEQNANATPTEVSADPVAAGGSAPATDDAAAPGGLPDGGNSAGATDLAEHESSGDLGPIDLQTIGGIGGALAAGFLGWLTVRRLLQRRKRSAGQRIAMPEPDVAEIETQLRAVDGTAAVLHLDHALRAIAVDAQDTSSPMPSIAVARVTAAEVVLYLEDPSILPSPFIPAAQDDSAWSISTASLPPLDREPSSACPALVSIGNDTSGAMLFIDLERLGVLTIDGDEPLVRAALMALSLELATSTWGDDLRLTLVGFDERLNDELSSGRIRHVSDLRTLGREFAVGQRHIRAALSDLGTESLAAARTSSPEAESWGVEVVLVGAPSNEETHETLSALALDEPRVGIAAVFGRGHDEGWRLELHAADSATLQLPAGAGAIELNPQLLTELDYDRLIELAHVTAGSAVDVARPGTDHDWTLTLLPADSPRIDLEDEAEAKAEAEIQIRDDVNDEPGIGERPGAAPTNEAALINESPREQPSDSTRDASPSDSESSVAPQSTGAPPPVLAAPVNAAGTASVSDLDEALASALNELAPEIDEAARRITEPLPPRERNVRARRRRASGQRAGDDLDQDARTLVQSLGQRPWVRLLGSVELHGATGTPPMTPQTNELNNSTVKRATELVAYLALHPGTTAEEFHAAFWPGKDSRGKTAASNRNGLATRARKWLGSAPDGEPYFPHVGAHGYRLNEQVTTDWHIFLDLVGDDLGTAPTGRLRAALDLVQGQPFSGVKERFYGWAEVPRMDMLATIADVCHELAARALQVGDIGTARTSAALGREIDPINETSWRDAMQAELLAGDQAGFERIVSLLQQQLDDFEDGYEPEPETQEMIDTGRGGPSLLLRPEESVVPV